MIFNDVILFEPMAKSKSEQSYTLAWNKHPTGINFQIPVPSNSMLIHGCFRYRLVFGINFPTCPSPKGDIFASLRAVFEWVKNALEKNHSTICHIWNLSGTKTLPHAGISVLLEFSHFPFMMSFLLKTRSPSELQFIEQTQLQPFIQRFYSKTMISSIRWFRI